MKLGGPETGGGEGGGFFSGARERLRELTQISESTVPTQEERDEAQRQVAYTELQTQQEQSQTPEAQAAREAQINQFIADFDRLGETRTTEEVDDFLRTTNTNVSDNSARAEAYGRWKEQRARETVVSLDDYRTKSPDETEPVEEVS